MVLCLNCLKGEFAMVILPEDITGTNEKSIGPIVNRTKHLLRAIASMDKK